MTEINHTAKQVQAHINKLEEPEHIEITPLASVSAQVAAETSHSQSVGKVEGKEEKERAGDNYSHAGIAYIRQVRQAGLLDGISRVLADVYGERNQNQLSLFDLLQRMGVDSVAVGALGRTQGQPVVNKLLDRLSHRMALTAEGHKQFQILKLLYGLNGEPPRSATEIALLAGLALKDVKHLFIMMRCRLESEQVRTYIEETLKTLTDEFIRSPLYDEVVTAEGGRGAIDFAPADDSCRVAEAQDLCATIKDLEALADELIGDIDNKPTVNVCGHAGTGKSSLAMKVTSRLLHQGKRVLYVTHSRFFANHVQRCTNFFPGDLTVTTFHAMCHLYAKEVGIAIPTYRNNKVFNELFPELLIEAVHKRPDLAFDAIVVDEGHSFLPNFWRALKFCLKDLHGSAFFFFYDPLIMGLAKNKVAPFAVRSVKLTKELRPNFRLPAISGGLEVFEAVTKEESSQALSKALIDLVRQGFRPDEIAILSALDVPKVSQNRSSLPKGLKLAATPGNREKHILYTSLSSFRAMSKKAVILVLEKEVEDMPEWKIKHLSYLAFSRVDQKLILIGNINSIAKVLPSGVKIINPEVFEAQLRRQ